MFFMKLFRRINYLEVRIRHLSYRLEEINILKDHYNNMTHDEVCSMYGLFSPLQCSIHEPTIEHGHKRTHYSQMYYDHIKRKWIEIERVMPFMQPVATTLPPPNDGETVTKSG